MEETANIRQLAAFIALAKAQGLEIRHEWLGGKGGGICQIRGKPTLFLDVSCGPTEQLEMIEKSLQTSRRGTSPVSGNIGLSGQ